MSSFQASSASRCRALLTRRARHSRFDISVQRCGREIQSSCITIRPTFGAGPACARLHLDASRIKRDRFARRRRGERGRRGHNSAAVHERRFVPSFPPEGAGPVVLGSRPLVVKPPFGSFSTCRARRGCSSRRGGESAMRGSDILSLALPSLLHGMLERAAVREGQRPGRCRSCSWRRDARWHFIDWPPERKRARHGAGQAFSSFTVFSATSRTEPLGALCPARSCSASALPSSWTFW